MKKIYALGLLGLFAMAFVSAIWFLDFHGNVIFNVTSDPLINFEWDLTSSDLDTTAGAVSVTKSLIVENSNGAKLYNIFWNVTKTDIDDNCFDHENDVTLIVTQGVSKNPIGLGASFNLPTGTYPLNFELTAVKSSCPGSVVVDVALIPQD